MASPNHYARTGKAGLLYPCFTKDSVKEAMADGFGSNSDMFRSKGSTATISIMLHIAECFLETGKICILEANFLVSQGEQIKLMIQKHNTKCLTFLFVGDNDVLWNRYEQREATRHWAHIFEGQSKEKFIKGHTSPEAGVGNIYIGQTVKVDTTDFATVDYNELFAIAERFVSGNTL